MLFDFLHIRTEAIKDLSSRPPLDRNFVAGRAPKSKESVLVIGSGLAGLSAALSAIEQGSNVILFEKMEAVGGNSAKATSGINGCGTTAQKIRGIRDSHELFLSDTLSSGDRENDFALVDLLVLESSSAVQFLIDNGVDLSDINLCGGHSVPRTHWLPSPKEGKPLPVGVAIIRALKSRLEKISEQNPEKLTILLKTNVIGFVTWNDFVTGVRFKNSENKIEEVSGKAVILTTGGFSSDRTTDGTSLLTEFAPNLLHLPTTNGQFATGDGIKMARAMGASIVGMEHVQVHPTAFIDPKDPGAKTKFLAAEALRGKGAILINEKGRRFANELGRRDYLTRMINEFCKKDAEGLHTAYMLMNNQSADDFGRPAFNFYSKIKRFFQEFKNVKQLTETIGLSEKNLLETLKNYNVNFNKAKTDSTFKDDYGKAIFPVKFDENEKVYVAKITPAIHYTMGGLKIDKKAVVFSDLLGRPIQGLLAAGEVTGGVHGRNRLAGNSLLECVVFGRIAGRTAASINYQNEQILQAQQNDQIPTSGHKEL